MNGLRQVTVVAFFVKKRLMLVVAILILQTSYLQAKEIKPLTPELGETLALRKYLKRGYAHENDTDWISFGPAILESCRSLVLIDGYGMELICNEADRNFPSIKTWITNRIGHKLNCSPNKTVLHGCKTAQRSLILYASPTVPKSITSEDSALSPDEYREKETKMLDTLIVVPITSNVLGCSQAEADAEFTKLRMLMGDGKKGTD